MIKVKTLLKLLICLTAILSISSNSFARLIVPEPKPKEFITEQTLPAKKPVRKPVKKVIPKIIKPKETTNQNVNNIKKQQTIKKEIIKEKTKEPPKEEFTVSNQIIHLKKPLDLGISKKKSKILSSKDFLISQKTF
jgi:hypothetical protein